MITNSEKKKKTGATLGGAKEIRVVECVGMRAKEITRQKYNTKTSKNTQCNYLRIIVHEWIPEGNAMNKLGILQGGQFVGERSLFEEKRCACSCPRHLCAHVSEEIRGVTSKQHQEMAGHREKIAKDFPHQL